MGWSGSILQIRTNIIKVGSKSWLLSCSSNITLSLLSYTAVNIIRWDDGKIVGFYFEEVMLLSAGGPDGSQMVLT